MLENEKKETHKPILEQWFSMECALHKNKQLSIEQKGSMAYSLLTAAMNAEEINSDGRKRLFGEFMAATLGLNTFSYH